MSSQDDVNCPHCGNRYKRRGLAIHIRAAHKNSNVPLSEEPNTVTETNPVITPLEKAFNAPFLNSSSNNSDDIWFKRWKLICQLHGKQYDLPNGTCSRQFVYTLAEEIEALVRNDFPSERLIVFIAVILQRDKLVKQCKDIRRLLDRRLQLWQANEIDILITEAIRSDKQLISQNNRKQEVSNVIRVFTRLMLRGKVRDAVSWLIDNGTTSVLKPNAMVDSTNKTVFDVLQEKHPDPHETDSTLFTENVDDLPRLQAVDVTSEIVEKVARKIHGGGGPGGSNSEQWTDFLLRFGRASHRVRDAVAQLCCKLNNESIPWKQIQALLSSRLIALDKCPGVRPIGIGECLRRILSKCMVEIAGDDVTYACGKDQLCSGLKGGIEGAVHAMSTKFRSESSPGSNWGLLLIDAENGFNKINRQVALWQARKNWPRCAQYLYNTYRGHSTLVLRDSTEFLFSKEGVTQGDPLSMPMYALATLPVIESLKCHVDVTQCWYADDSSAQGTFDDLKNWWNDLRIKGPMYGYYPQSEKSCLIVCEEDKSKAEEVFKNTNIKVVTGKRYLGGFIGTDEEKKSFIKTKTDEWKSIVEKLTTVCKEEPQAAYAALTKSVQFKWTYFQRVMEDTDQEFTLLHESIRTMFLPSLFGGSLSRDEENMVCLPVQKGGLGILNPCSNAALNYETSKQCTSILSQSIINGNELDMNMHMKYMKEKKKIGVTQKQINDDELLNSTIENFTNHKRRAIERSIAKITKTKTSNWLSVLPIKKDHFDMSPSEFRDALAMRYHRQPTAMPKSCDGCGARDFSLEHALCCKTGGLVTRRHNEVRDVLGELCEKAWGNTVKEPIINEDGPGLRGDLAVRGVWEAQREALFDIRVVDTDAPSHVSRTVQAVLVSAEEEKKRKYSAACEQRHATFTPLVTSVDGVFAPQMQSFVLAICERLSERWSKPYTSIVGWVRSRLSVAIQRAASMCIRAARRRWRGGESLLGYEDGVAEWKS